jgi:hypothetical protein
LSNALQCSGYLTSCNLSSFAAGVPHQNETSCVVLASEHRCCDDVVDVANRLGICSCNFTSTRVSANSFAIVFAFRTASFVYSVICGRRGKVRVAMLKALTVLVIVNYVRQHRPDIDAGSRLCRTCNSTSSAYIVIVHVPPSDCCVIVDCFLHVEDYTEQTIGSVSMKMAGRC